MEIVLFVKRNDAQPPKTVTVTMRQLVVALAVVLVLLAGGAYMGAVEISKGWLERRSPIAYELAQDVLRDLEERREQEWEVQVEALSEQIAELHARIIELQIQGGVIAERAGVAAGKIFDTAAAGCDHYLLPDKVGSPELVQAVKQDFWADESNKDNRGLPENPPSLQCYGKTVADIARKYEVLEQHGARAFVSYDTVPMERPIVGRNWRTSRFGMRRDPFTGRRAFHGGYDYAARRGTPIIAAATGVVTYAGRLGNYGNAVRISHGNSVSTLYAHMHSIDVEPGQYVKRGEQIGGVGNTGRSTGPHLHFEVRVNNRQRAVAPEIRKIRKARAVPKGWKN